MAKHRHKITNTTTHLTNTETKTDCKDALLLAGIIRFGHVSETKPDLETVLKPKVFRCFAL